MSSEALGKRRASAVARGVSSVISSYVDSATGASMTDVDGREWLDFASGIAVTSVGNAAPRVVEAVRRRSRGWAAAAALLALTFYVAPFRWLPHEHDAELTWTPAQQVVGATYVIVGIAALVALRIAFARSDRPAAVAS